MSVRSLPVVVATLIGVSLFPEAIRGQAPPPPSGGGSYNVSVTPAGTILGVLLNSSHDTAIFTVTNTGTNSDEYTLACSSSGGVTCISVSNTDMVLAGGAHQLDTVVYSFATATPAFVYLQATGTHLPPDNSTGYYTVTAAPTITIVAPVATSGRAVVHNRQPVLRALFTPNGSPLDTTKTVLMWGTDSVTKFRTDTLSTARVNRGLVEWDVDALRGLGPPADSALRADSALMTVKVCAQNGLCTTVTQWVVLLNDHKPVLGFTGVPLEALGRQFGAPFGPGFSVAGVDVQTGFSIPPYFSMNAARSAGLVYSTRQSYPRAIVPVDIELPWPSSTPSKVHVTLLDGATRLDSLILTSPTCLTGSAHRCRAVLQADYSGSTLSTPTRKWLTVQVQVDSATTTQLANDSVEVVLVDRRTTMYGSGWWPSVFSKLVVAGNDRLLVGPTGTATIFRGNGDSLYLAPPGDFSTLVKNPSGHSGWWGLTARGSKAQVLFDANGRLAETVDQNGNVDSLHYVGSTDTLQKIVDRTGQAITLAYDANHKIHTFTDPGGRVSRVTVNSGTNQLTSDSLASPSTRTDTASFVYQTYSGTGTVLVTKHIGVIGDTTVVGYDSSTSHGGSLRWRRPSQVTLPIVATDTNNSVKPVIKYAPVESQGWVNLVALTATTVQMTDARNNWTRSWLNRWGQARAAWDTLGVLDSTTYTPDGFVLHSQGKSGDSTRVFTDYDVQWRPVKTWYIRSSGHLYRADSLVYDSLSRVVSVLSPNSQTTQTTYDANGNVIKVAHLAVSGDTVRYWVHSNGLVDSTAQGSNPPVRYLYDASTQNLLTVVDQSNVAIEQKEYDSYGRVVLDAHRRGVQVSDTTYYVQWRLDSVAFSSDNQVDSTVTQQSNNCIPKVDPGDCDWGSILVTWTSDTLHVRHTKFQYDRAGRDTVRLNDRGNGPRYRYDRLGRVIARYPWASNTTIRDSMAYDIAGNVKKTITRLGDTLTSNFDSRNRDTLTVIPGVGNRRRRFTGPNDELTVVYDSVPTDLIGTVNGRVAYAYDHHGRLLSDSSYRSTSGVGTTYSYDSLERVVTWTDPRGGWSLSYEQARGYVTQLTTPALDTLTYSCDSLEHCIGPTITNSGTRLVRTPHWNSSGTLDRLTISPRLAGKAYNAGLQYRLESQNNEDPFLLPVWQEQRDTTLATQHTFADTAGYDAWGELVAWYDVKDHSTSRSESYHYDRTENMTFTGTSVDSIDITTDRLVKRVTSTDTLWYTYDNNGSLIKTVHRTGGSAKDSTTYGYDALGQLRSVYHNGTKIVYYGYDVLGRRIAKRVYSTATGGVVGFTRYVYHGGQVNFETDSAGNMGYKYTWGMAGVDDIVAVDSGSNHYYAVTDKLGSVRGLVKKDGTWQWGTQYTPYGLVFEHDSVTGSTPRLPLGWTGARLDPETGFYFLRNRNYDPGAGRFTQEDPAGYSGGGNVYAYGSGSPLSGRDPAGTRMEEEMYEPCHHCQDLDAINASDGLDMWGGVEQLRAYDDLAWLSYEDYQTKWSANVQDYFKYINSSMKNSYDVDGRALTLDEFNDAKDGLLDLMGDVVSNPSGFSNSAGVAALLNISVALELGRIGYSQRVIDYVNRQPGAGAGFRAFTAMVPSKFGYAIPVITFMGVDQDLVTYVHEGYHWTWPFPGDAHNDFDSDARDFIHSVQMR